jgi:hypothetical protein
MGNGFYIAFFSFILAFCNLITIKLNDRTCQDKLIYYITRKVSKIINPAFFIRLLFELNHEILLASLVQFSVAKGS